MPIRHERMGASGSSSWMHVVDGPPYPWGDKFRKRAFKFEHIFHQVRHPLRVIASLDTIMKPSWKFIAQNIKLPEGSLRRRMKFWVTWNKLCEKQATFRYRIEDINNELPKICKLLGIKQQEAPPIDKKVNTRKHVAKYAVPTWESLRKANAPLAAQIAEMSKRYGYK